MLLIFGYPIALVGRHGLDTSAWPSGVTTIDQWSALLSSFNVIEIITRYWDMAHNDAADFAGYSRVVLALTALPFAISAVILIRIKPLEQERDQHGIHGNARWANDKEIEKMATGLELGVQKTTGHVVRVSIEGNLLTIAPPRKGKTSGLLIPNLAFPEPRAWSGPAIVIDPKGDVFRAVASRRRQMGRTVRCIDPVNLVGGTDTWNPLESVDHSDVLYFQHTARVLLPVAPGADSTATYFNNRAVDLIVGAMLVAMHSQNRNLPEVLRLLNDEDAFIAGLILHDTQRAAISALSIMRTDPKTRDPILSTASQAFSWLNDDRLCNLVASNSFDMRDITNGDTDLFIAVPARDNEALAPFLRWMLADIFDTIRAHHPAERIVIFIDEAATLGKFDAIVKAAGELPGHGASLWTIWQDRAQIQSIYGEFGARTLIGTADIVTLFDTPATDPDESDRWSRALGNFSAIVETISSSGKSSGPTTSNAVQEARLMTKEEMTTALGNDELIVFPNSRYYARHPIRLLKTVAYDDRRFAKLINQVAPVKRL